VPVTVSVKAPPPAVVLFGLIELRPGTGFVAVTLKVFPLDVPPPGVGFRTVTEKFPVAETSLAKICACSCVLLTYVVVRLLPAQRTTDELLKFVPVALRVNAPLPTAAVLGLIELSVGDGLLTVNVFAPDVPPPGAGLNTVTWTVPAVAMSAAEICA
jgi:hypothetical protein